MKDNGGSAFPTLKIDLPNGEIQWPETGMTLRDYFATKAMKGIMSAENWVGDIDGTAHEAYQMADAMLKARTE